MSGCRVLFGHTMDLTLHARGTDRVLWSCKSNLPLDPNLFSTDACRTNFFNQSKFECLGEASSLKLHWIWQCAHMELIRCHSLANRTLRWTFMQNREENFTASSNAWGLIRIPYTQVLTWHAHNVDVLVVAIRHTRIQNCSEGRSFHFFFLDDDGDEKKNRFWTFASAWRCYQYCWKNRRNWAEHNFFFKYFITKNQLLMANKVPFRQTFQNIGSWLKQLGHNRHSQNDDLLI